MLDLRGHGESQGERYSYGVYERRDVLGAVDWLIGQGLEPGKIGTLGLSLGAAATIGAAAEEPAIGLVVTEGAFADFYPLIAPHWQEESGFPNLFLPGVFLMNQVLYGYSVADLRPVAEFPRLAPRPVLLIHCTTDEQVDLSHAEALKRALPSAETWYVDGCAHAQIYRDYPQAYEARVIGFLNEHFQ